MGDFCPDPTGGQNLKRGDGTAKGYSEGMVCLKRIAGLEGWEEREGQLC